MSDQFFKQPILNSPYGYPSLHWELDEKGNLHSKSSNLVEHPASLARFQNHAGTVVSRLLWRWMKSRTCLTTGSATDTLN